jgi:diketogulonate reductase-like aldo/keto reductase
MIEPDNLRSTKMPLNNGSAAIPAFGFGTSIPDPVATKNATKAALETGFRQLDTAERYRTEEEVGEAGAAARTPAVWQSRGANTALQKNRACSHEDIVR